MDLKTLLALRGSAVHTLPPDAGVEEAFELVKGGKRPPYVVVEGGKPTGIVTEGLLLARCLEREGMVETPIRVGEVMSRNLMVAGVDDAVARHAPMMLERGIEWVVVEGGGRIEGMLHFNDLVRHHIEVLTAEIETLREYIASLQDAMLD